MNTSLTSLAIALPLVAGTAGVLSGCGRQEAVATTSPTTIRTEIDDSVLTAKVKSKLLGEQDFKGYDLKVATRKGTVLLCGFVDSRAQIDRAIAVAQAVPGVQGVSNEMSVRK